MDGPKLGGAERFAFAFEIRHLAGDQLQRTGGPGEFENDVLMAVTRPGAALCSDFKVCRNSASPASTAMPSPNTL